MYPDEKRERRKKEIFVFNSKIGIFRGYNNIKLYIIL